jgi:hypothetical protein
MANRTAAEMLKDQLPAKHANSIIRHFNGLVTDFQGRDWEDSIAKGGKFVEAVTKAIWEFSGDTVPPGKNFSAGNLLDRLSQKTAISDSLRLTIPRACRFVYEVASNRGGRHDPDEVEANEMDANAVLANCSWVLGELIRFTQHGMDLAEAKDVVDGLTKRKFPFAETIDGRIYISKAESAREVALLILYAAYPKRMPVDSLVDQVRRHGYKKANSARAVERIANLVDNKNEELLLRADGLRAAEELI